MLLKKIFAASALSATLASPALAEEHIIILTGFSYFPAITYAQPGDSVRFVNESGDRETVVGRDAGWTVGPLNDGDEGLLTVTSETELAFFSAYKECANDSGGTDGNCGTGDDQTTGAAEYDPSTSTDYVDVEEKYGTWEEASIKAEISFEIPVLEPTGDDS